MTPTEKLAAQVECVRHYLHMQIGKPLKPELASAPEIALDELQSLINETLRSHSLSVPAMASEEIETAVDSALHAFCVHDINLPHWFGRAEKARLAARLLAALSPKTSLASEPPVCARPMASEEEIAKIICSALGDYWWQTDDLSEYRRASNNRYRHAANKLLAALPPKNVEVQAGRLTADEIASLEALRDHTIATAILDYSGGRGRTESGKAVDAINRALALLNQDAASKCTWPDCDGGHATGYCHAACRDQDSASEKQ